MNVDNRPAALTAVGVLMSWYTLEEFVGFSNAKAFILVGGCVFIMASICYGLTRIGKDF